MLAFAEDHEPGILRYYREEAERLQKESQGMCGRGPSPWDVVYTWGGRTST